jgi:Major Facilitator Superfamily
MGAYRSLLAGVGARRLAIASALGWLGFGALSLAIVLTVQRAAGSSAAAGVALTGFALGSGVLAPARGRLVDRFGPRQALVPFASGSGAALLGLALAAKERTADWLLVALATLGGLTVPPLIASARVVWPQVVAPELLPPAYGVQALLGDLGGVGGPALAGALTALASPSAALVACALLPAAGALLLARLPWPERSPPRGRGGALASPGMRTLVLADAGLYAGLGALEVALPAIAAREGAAASAALPLAAFAAASAVVSLVWGARPAAQGRRYVLGSLALTVVCVPLAWLGSVWSLAVVLLAALALPAAGSALAYAVVVARRATLEIPRRPHSGA